MVENNKSLNKQIGDKGEMLAKDYLEKNGLKIVERNYYKNKGEIDIIAFDKEVIVFIEVKLRNSLKYGHPLESINKKKIDKLINTASLYLQENKLESRNIRFDVVSILLNNGLYEINHITDAF